MTVRITHRGSLPEQDPYAGTCSYCHTRFECVRSDGKYHDGDQRDGPFLRLDCPLCGRSTVAYPARKGGPIVSFPRD